MYNKKTLIAVIGAGGRMGKQIIKTALQTKEVTIGAAIERKNSSLLGLDIGQITSTKRNTGIFVQNSLDKVKNDFDILIDFTNPQNTINSIKFCCEHNKKIVIGTTGFKEKEMEIITTAAEKIAIFLSVNFSLGINLIIKLFNNMNKLINNFNDIKIKEIHHKDKIDSPSGTAIFIGNLINKYLNKNLNNYSTYYNLYDVKKISSKINFVIERKENVISKHAFIISNNEEYIKITHNILNRIIFSKNAIRSAIWLKEKTKGLFDMQDMLDFK